MKGIVKSKNHRVTMQREIILEEICKVCTHPTASEIYKMAQKRLPDIGLATVYRSLDFLERNKLIIKLKSKNKEARYDGNANSHCHLICKKCGCVIDIFDLEEVTIKSKQLKKSGFRPLLDFLEIPGICQKCF